MRELIPLRSFLLELCSIIIILRLQDFNWRLVSKALKLEIIQRLASVPRSNAWPIKFQIKFVITLSKIRSILDPGCWAALSRFKFGCLFSVESSLRVCCVTTKNTERINTERENPECRCEAWCSYYRRSLGSRMNTTYTLSNFKGESRIVKLGIFGGAQWS